MLGMMGKQGFKETCEEMLIYLIYDRKTRCIEFYFS
jgi:hypothetical protein